MPKVYLGGPIQNCTPIEATGWRTEAKKLLGAEHCLSPTDWCFVSDESVLSDADCRKLVLSDLAALEKADAVLYCAWKPSFGAPMEAWEARQMGKLVVVVRSGPLSSWLRFVADHVVDSVSEGCAIIASELGIPAPCLK